MVNPFAKERRDMRHSWGYTYEWTPEHQTKEQLRPLTFSYDVLGADCLDRLDAISPPGSSRPSPRASVDGTHENTAKASSKGDRTGAHPRRDLYALLEQHHASDTRLHELWTQVHTVPSWVDWDQIGRGQDVFYRYGGPSIVSLTFQSLVGGMGGRRVVETLARTGGFGAKTAKRRLLETFQHILQVTKDLESIKPGGDGFASSTKVRLLHASVRRRILALARERPGYFDVADWGVPINDLDCIGTVLTFSSALVWIGLPRQGIYLREQEIADYSAMWRWVGYLLGTPTDPWLVDPRRSKIMLESLIEADINPSDMSAVLANNILTGLSCQPPTFVSREFLCAEAYWLNGWELSQALGIQQPSLWHRVLVAGQCLYFMGTSYIFRSVPQWDRRKITRARRILYNLVVHDRQIGLGQTTNFDFQYVPQLGRTTELGQPEGSKVRVGAPERQGLTTLVLGAGFIGAVVWFGFRSASGHLGTVHVVS